MSDIVEKVARAAFEEAAKPEHGFYFSGLHWDDAPALQVAFRAITRAAIEAMREPTDDMVYAGLRAGWTCRGAVRVVAVVPVAFQAMIDAALSPKESEK